MKNLEKMIKEGFKKTDIRVGKMPVYHKQYFNGSSNTIDKEEYIVYNKKRDYGVYYIAAKKSNGGYNVKIKNMFPDKSKRHYNENVNNHFFKYCLALEGTKLRKRHEFAFEHCKRIQQQISTKGEEKIWINGKRVK